MQESPFGPKPYIDPKESARVRANRAQSFADGVLSAIRGAVKSVTTDLPGLVLDAVDKLAGDTKSFGEKDRSEQMFSAVTGTKKGDSTAEMLGSFVNPIAATQAMIVPALLTRNLSEVRKATKMLDAGLSDEAVLAATGMFAGPNAQVDGIVRTFLSDQGAKLKYSTELDDTGIGRRPSTYITPGAVMGPDMIISAPWGSSSKLEDILDHPELFKADPSLRDIRVGPTLGYGGAYYKAAKDFIGLGAQGKPVDMLSTILHEVQHAIQSRNNMMLGGSPEMFLQDAAKINDASSTLRESFKIAGDRAAPVAKSLKSNLYSPSEALQKTPEYQQWKLLRDSIDRISEVKTSAYDNYKLLGGEIEAFGTEQMFRRNSTNPLEIYPPSRTPIDSLTVPDSKPLDQDPIIQAILRFVDTRNRAKPAKDTK